MLISQYESGKEKVIANDEKERWGSEKECTFQDSLSYVPSLTTVSAKRQLKRPRVICRTPPLPHRSLTWFYKDPP